MKKEQPKIFVIPESKYASPRSKMGDLLQFTTPKKSNTEPLSSAEVQVSSMEPKTWYILNPPSIVKGRKYHKVKCLFKADTGPNEYIVEGVAEGETNESLFVLRFSKTGVRVYSSDEQNN